MTELLRSTSWRKSQSQGCCGLFELYRLKASYETEESATERIEALKAAGVIEGSKVQLQGTLHDTLTSMSKSTYQWTYPVEWGFTGILSKLSSPTIPPNIFFLSDNLDEDGDVHNGAFSTKNLVAWLKDMDVGPVHDTPSQKSHRGGNHPIQVWIWHPDWKKVREVVAQCFELAKEYTKEIASVEESITEQRKDRNAELIGKFNRAAGWE